MYFHQPSGILLQSIAQVKLAQQQDPNYQIYWEIEKYIKNIDNVTINYQYSSPSSLPNGIPTTTTGNQNSSIDVWNIVGWVMLIAGGAAIIIGAGRWSKSPETPTSVQGE